MGHKKKTITINKRLALEILQEDLRNFEKAGGRVALVAHTLRDGRSAALVVLVGATVADTPEGLVLTPSEDASTGEEGASTLERRASTEGESHRASM